MSDTTSKEFRNALASAIKYHVESNGLNGVSASKIVGIANSRMSQIIRGDVDKISSDALIDILGKFSYRFSSVIGSVDGHEFTLIPYEKGEWEKFDADLEANTVDGEPIPYVDGVVTLNGNEIVSSKDFTGGGYVAGKPCELAGVVSEGYVLINDDSADPDADRVIADG